MYGPGVTGQSSTWPGVPGSCRRGKRLGNIVLTPLTRHYLTLLDIRSAVPACYRRMAIDRLLQTLAAQDRPLSGKLRQRRNYRLAVSWLSSPDASDTVTGSGPAVRPAAIPAPRPHGRRDPWLRSGSEDGMTLPLAGWPGHGRTAFVRLQPARIVDGRFEGGYTGLFELICPGCGDHPYLDYSEITPRLQWLRGPRTLQAALAAYDKHLAPPGTNGDSARSLGAGYAKPRPGGCTSMITAITSS